MVCYGMVFGSRGVWRWWLPSFVCLGGDLGGGVFVGRENYGESEKRGFGLALCHMCVIQSSCREAAFGTKGGLCHALYAPLKEKQEMPPR